MYTSKKMHFNGTELILSKENESLKKKIKDLQEENRELLRKIEILQWILASVFGLAVFILIEGILY